jgi:hypothetical protein
MYNNKVSIGINEIANKDLCEQVTHTHIFLGFWEFGVFPNLF